MNRSKTKSAQKRILVSVLSIILLAATLSPLGAFAGSEAAPNEIATDSTDAGLLNSAESDTATPTGEVSAADVALQSPAEEASVFGTLPEEESALGALGAEEGAGDEASLRLLADATVANQGELDTEISGAPTDGTLYTIEVTANFTISSSVVIAAGKNIVLTGDSTTRTITRDSGFFGDLFTNNGTLTVGNLIIDGGGSAILGVSGALINNGNGATLTLSDGAVLQNNIRATGNGGGIQFGNYGTLTMTGGTISGNSALNLHGGGLYFGDFGTLTMTGGAISENSSVQRGGGAYFGASATITLSGTAAIDSNHSGVTGTGNGAGIRIGTGTLANPTQVRMSGSAAIINNTAGTRLIDTGTGSGGLVLQDTGDYAYITLEDNASISNNSGTPGDAGGGVYLVGAHSTMSLSENAKVNNNSCGQGGGIYIGTSTHLLIADNASVSGNTANGNSTINVGGGIYSSGGVIAMSAGAISDNDSYRGGGVFLDTASTFVMSGGKISDNHCEPAPGGGTSASGGGVYMYGAGTTFTMIDGAIAGNLGYQGGGVYLGEASTFAMSGGEISDNHCEPAPGGGTSASGGGVYMYGAGTTFTMIDGAISGNLGYQGGGIFMNNATASINMSGGSIDGNHASTQYVPAGLAANGGGIILAAGTFSQSGGSITGNTADNAGGGVRFQGTTYNLTGGTISGNKALGTVVGGVNSGAGGGIYTTKAMTIADTANPIRISGNTANTDGGGIYIGKSDSGDTTGAVVSVQGSTVISGNTAANNGGGAFIIPNASPSASLTVTDNVLISANTATQNGGGVYNVAANGLTVNGGSISGNRGTLGGGIFTSNSILIERGAITGNTSSSDGGGIYLDTAAGALSVTGPADIAGNTAGGNGGGIWVAPDLRAQLNVASGATFSNNKAVTFASAVMPPDLPVYNAHILKANGTWTTSPKTLASFVRGYNNYDINYDKPKTAVPESGTTVRTGDVITFTIAAAAGSSGSLTIRDTVDTSLAGILSGSYGTGVLSGSTITWTFSGLAPGEKRTVSFDVVVKGDAAGKTLENKARIVNDFNFDTNTTTHDIDPAKTASAGGGTLHTGDVITYTITGTADKYGTLVITDTVDTSVAAIGAIRNGGVKSGQTITWTFSGIGAGSIRTVSFDVVVTAESGVLKNKALLNGHDTNTTANDISNPSFVLIYDLNDGGDINDPAAYGTNGAAKDKVRFHALISSADHYTLNPADAKAPVRAGYTFGGWYRNAGATAAVGAATMPMANKTIYAKWTAKHYTVHYDTNGGTPEVIADKIVRWREAGLLPAENPVLAGYTFLRWDVTEGGNGTADNTNVQNAAAYASLAANEQTMAITLTAQWSYNTSPPPSDPPRPPVDPPRPSVDPPVIPPDPPKPPVDPPLPPVQTEVDVPEPAEPEAPEATAETGASIIGLSTEDTSKLKAQTGNIFGDLANGNVPLGNFRALGAWSLLSLILSLIGAILAIALVLRAAGRKRTREEEYLEDTAEEDKEEIVQREARKKRRRRILRALAVLFGVITGIVWLILDDLTLPMTWINTYTPYVILCFALALVLSILIRAFGEKRVPEDEQIVAPGQDGAGEEIRTNQGNKKFRTAGILTIILAAAGIVIFVILSGSGRHWQQIGGLIFLVLLGIPLVISAVFDRDMLAMAEERDTKNI